MLIIIKKWLKNLPIKHRLLYGYLVSFLFILLSCSSLIYLLVKTDLDNKLEEQVKSHNHTLEQAVIAIIDNSASSALRIHTEKNRQLIASIYQQDMPENDAKKKAAELLNSQAVGSSGFFYTINSLGRVKTHPDKSQLEKDLSSDKQVIKILAAKSGYFSFKKASGEGPAETWSSYSTYFGPWDWIITAVTSKKELFDASTEAAVRRVIENKTGLQSGENFIIDHQANFIIHSTLEGKNISDLLSDEASDFFKRIQIQKSGRLEYNWRTIENPEKHKYIAEISYLPEQQWYIITSLDTEKYYYLLRKLLHIIQITFILTVIIIFLISYQLSQSIVKPVKYLTAGLEAAASGDFSKRLKPRYTDELGQLETYFNTFISRLEESNRQLQLSERGFRSIFENSVEGIFLFDMEGRLLKVNPSFVAMLGYSSGQSLIDQKINFKNDLLVQKELWNPLIDQIIGERTVKGCEMQIRKKSGAVFWCLLNARGIYNDQGDTIETIEGFISDIDAKKSTQEDQQKLMEDLESMVNDRTVQLSGRIAELEQRNEVNQQLGEMADMLQCCKTINETFPIISQYLRKLYPEDSCFLFLHDAEREVIEQVIPPLEGEGPFINMTNDSCWALRQGKRYLFNDEEHELICDHVRSPGCGYICVPLIAHGVTIGLLHILFGNKEENISLAFSEKRLRMASRLAEHLSLALSNLRLREELKLKSIQDSLTGLANRRHMEEIMQRQFYRFLRHQTPCSIIMIDVDHFKTFNDHYGHETGDLVLKKLASYLKDHTRGEDLACRYGGEEFIIILVNTGIDEAIKKAENLRADIAENVTIPHNSETLHITASMGVAACPDHGRGPTELVKSADDALYRAKDNGRNRVEIALTVDELPPSSPDAL